MCRRNYDPEYYTTEGVHGALSLRLAVPERD